VYVSVFIKYSFQYCGDGDRSSIQLIQLSFCVRSCPSFPFRIYFSSFQSSSLHLYPTILIKWRHWVFSFHLFRLFAQSARTEYASSIVCLDGLTKTAFTLVRRSDASQEATSARPKFTLVQTPSSHQERNPSKRGYSKSSSNVLVATTS
jgi:hypothetical protein